MIPTLPEGMLDGDILDFYDKLSGNLTDQSTIHVHWWTHRQNPSVCWICDMVTLISKILEITQEKYTKSRTDMLIDESTGQEEDSDPEIENYNVNDEADRTPEYELEDASEESSGEAI